MTKTMRLIYWIFTMASAIALFGLALEHPGRLSGH